MNAKIKVLGKEIDRGFFGGKKHKVIVDIAGRVGGQPHVITVPIEQYYQFQEGKEYNITMYQYPDGLWYFQPLFSL